MAKKVRRYKAKHSKKKAKRGRPRKKLDALGRVMSKVARGMKLTKREREILRGAIDGSKKARSEHHKTRK